MIARLRALWTYRHFLAHTIKADYRTRVAGSRLGFLWIIVQPLAQALMFAVILSGVLQARLPNSDIPGGYAVYLLAGISAWGLFSEIVTRSMTMFTDNAAVLKKISFPRICLPVTVLGVALINHGILLTAVIVISAFMGLWPSQAVLAFAVMVPLTALLALSLGTVLGVLHVFSRDVGQFMTIAMQIWFWGTPIVYPISIIPERLQAILHLNPVTAIAGGYQSIVLEQSWPDWAGLLYPAILALVVSVFALSLFQRASPDVIDAL